MKQSVLTLMSMENEILLFLTLILKIVDRGYDYLKHMGNMHNDLLIICLAYCLVITLIFQCLKH